MRNIALTFLSLAFALAAAMPSIADDIVELDMIRKLAGLSK